MLGRLLSLAIVLVIAYLLITRAWPLLQDQFGGGSQSSAASAAVDSEDGRCVSAAEAANERLISVAREYGQPPVDVDGWSSAMWDIESRLQTASTSCSCASQACDAASRALDEMRQLLSNLDGMVRGDSPGFANPANQQERIYTHLEAARQAAGL